MFDESRLGTKNGVSANIKIKDWLVLDLIGFLNFVPLIGSIACLIIYLMIGFGSGTAVSLKNRVLASFLWAVIWLIISIIFIVILFVFGGAVTLSGLIGNIDIQTYF